MRLCLDHQQLLTHRHVFICQGEGTVASTETRFTAKFISGLTAQNRQWHKLSSQYQAAVVPVIDAVSRFKNGCVSYLESLHGPAMHGLGSIRPKISIHTFIHSYIDCLIYSYYHTMHVQHLKHLSVLHCVCVHTHAFQYAALLNACTG